MIYVDNEGVTDPRINLAIEEYLLRRGPGDAILFFYINAPAIIIGRNQNTLEEINYEYVQAQGIHVVRRLSGGGAVYHDLGNLNFSFITEYRRDAFQNFELFTRPVIRVLQELGVPAGLSGRNDILVDGRKISGNAQYRTGERMFSHGTLLFNTQLDEVAAALNVKGDKIASKGLKSVRSRVANITEFLRAPLTIHEFKQHILRGVFEGADPIPTYALTPDDWSAIRTLAAERYMTWEWNYGQSPPCNIQKTQRFPVGAIDVRLDVHHGCIAALKIYGDFLGEGDVADVERCLIGARYEPQAIAAALSAVDLRNYFGEIELEAFVKLLF